MWEGLEAALAPPRAILEPFWCHFGASCGQLGGSRGHLRAILGPSGPTRDMLSPYWHQEGYQKTKGRSNACNTPPKSLFSCVFFTVLGVEGWSQRLSCGHLGGHLGTILEPSSGFLEPSSGFLGPSRPTWCQRGVCSSFPSI